MRARPILFSGPMIRALLDGRKTQTRRAVKPQPLSHHWSCIQGYKFIHALLDCEDGVVARFAHSIPQNREWDYDKDARCPYGRPGDLLWVRESATNCDKGENGLIYGEPIYRADVTDPYGLAFVTDDGPRYAEQLRWRPSIHMPRAWSRLTLRITDVRVQRLQDIDGLDAIAEGITRVEGEAPWRTYRRLWNEINGEGAWQANPWVWALTFDVIHENVDKVLA